MLPTDASSTDAAMPAYGQGASPGAGTIPPMPLGWKPGDSVPDIPPMPAGWRVGDPVPGSTRTVSQSPVASQAAEKVAPQQQPAPLPSAFDFILNPDLEEADEDFSSDEDLSDS